MTMTPHRGHHVRVDLTGDAAAPARARAFVALYARSLGLAAEQVQDLPHAVAELMAAAGSAHRPTALLVQGGRHGITLRVDFTGSEVPDVAEETVLLLSALSPEWGWRRLPETLQLWCRIPLRPPAGGSVHRRRRADDRAHAREGNFLPRAVLSSSTA